MSIRVCEAAVHFKRLMRVNGDVNQETQSLKLNAEIKRNERQNGRK